VGSENQACLPQDRAQDPSAYLYLLRCQQAIQRVGEATHPETGNHQRLKAIEIAENIIEIPLTLPQSGQIHRKILLLTEEQKYLGSIFSFGC
ncbi:MAG: hypothetical protein ACK5WO_09820, partial [Cyclobacteriaceae bacterium]